MHGKEVEILFSPLLLQEMEEAGISLPTPISPVLIPGRKRSSLSPTVSATFTSSRRRRHHHHRPSLSPTASELSTLAAAHSEPSSSAATPAVAEFPAGFGSRPGRRRHCRAVAIGEFRTDASYSSMEGPSAMASSQLFSPELVGGYPAPSAGHQSSVQPPVPAWVLTDLKQAECMKARCCSFVLHLMDHLEDLELVCDRLERLLLYPQCGTKRFYI
ncbi:hypothetical protein AMECASPLE_039730, partial [Ameca splendens]